MVELHFEGADMFLGPENTCVFSAKLAASLNKPIIGFVCHYYVNLKLRWKPKMAAKTQLALVKGQNAMLGLRTHYEQPNLFYLQQYCLKQRFQLTANTFIWTCVLNKSDIPRIFVRFIWQIRAVMCAVNVTAMASGHVCDRQTTK